MFYRLMASANPHLVCPLCPYERTAHFHLTLIAFLKHIKLFHAHQAGFKITCGISGCQRSFTNFGTFQNHVSGLHKHQLNPSNTSPAVDADPDESNAIDGHDVHSILSDRQDEEVGSQEVLQ